MKEEEERFKIRSYGWAELAMCYNPSVLPASASRLLRRWVNRNVPLSSSLAEAGFRDRQRVLTPKQVALIIDYLGEP
jgi:hypothetical protein